MLRCRIFVTGLVSLLLLTPSFAETANQYGAPTPNPPQRRSQAEEWEAQQQREMAKKENAKREQDLKKDTDKLLELATELKQYVDKTNENTLSIEVIKKAEAIEKLAHSVKEKMRGQ